ncbi:ParB/RepB/Spo0J family partition protein [Georgenia sp. SYP-B2076]|uniref:ParB/RepB/Spo0J family partition protein n=1 Tax=Georgenia sp. SYP-B2076 TaxID=2495881 RepID=UPI000F8D87CB|nr:ParB/RepB/Spo0J family partition protein [Georgenia sp. SYP-B2076]
MSEKRRGLGRGIGALIPSGPGQSASVARPVDVFFPPSSVTASSGDEAASADLDAEEAAAKAEGATRRSAASTAARALMEPSTTSRSKSQSAAARSRRAATSARAKAATKPAPAQEPAAADGPTAESVTAGGGVPASTAPAPAESTVTPAVTDPPTLTLPAEDPASAASAPTGHAAPDAAPDAAPAARTVEPESTPAEQEPDDGLVPVPGATFAELPLNQIVPNTRQPRQVFDEEDLEELAASIREVGVLQPVVVRALTAPVDDAPEARFELIMGERRWRASGQAGNETVPAIIRDTSDGDLLRDALLENLHRADLNALEEAAAYQQLLEDFGCTHDELANRIARSRPQISNTLRLLKLPPLVQRRVAAGVLSAGHARALLGLADGAAMERLAQKIVAEGLSVRATEEIVALGDEPTAPEMRRRPRAGTHAEALNHLATRLADRLDTRVKVNLGQRKGRIAIEFATLDDLNRILDVLAPGEGHVAPEGATQDA